MQGPLTAAVAKSPTNTVVLLNVDADGNLKVVTDNTGVDSSKVRATAAAVVKNAKGVLKRVVVLDPGTTNGEFTLNDVATVGGATAANTVWRLPYNGANALPGAVFELDIPCATGIVLSAVPGAGTPAVLVVYE